MKALKSCRRLASMLLIVPLLGLPLGCAVGYGYGDGATVGLGLDYYEPLGFDYGGWGPGYRVGPPRGGFRSGVGAPGHAYRPAPAGRSMPSIPAGGRSGGGRSGGGKRR
jgi:hypothetical protein